MNLTLSAHQVVAVLNDGREVVVETFHKRQTAVDVAKERTLQTGTEHFATQTLITR